MKRLSIFGSTGSIGKSTLDVVSQHPEKFKIEALIARHNVQELAKQAIAFHASEAIIADESCYSTLKALLAGTGIKVRAGEEALLETAVSPVDLIVMAMVGASALKPVMRALEAGISIALANKECLVCAGELLMEMAQKKGARILPIDSEHNAIFQVFEHTQRHRVERLILTASGGPFRKHRLEEMSQVTPEQALKHPNWQMGNKVTIDSATMMNKGLELIEAFHLFPVRLEQIEIIVHPESIIHSMVAYQDGSVLAQLGTPDMRTPIGYALGWPERIALTTPRLDFSQLATLQFQALDETRFPAPRLARETLMKGGTGPAMMNAANEVAVAAFLQRKIKFLEIIEITQNVIERLPVYALSLESVYEADRMARKEAENYINKCTFVN